MTKPAPAVHNHPLIEPFLDALWLERGLSDNTVSSYRTDLEKFALWLDGQGGYGIQTAPALSQLAAALLMDVALPDELQGLGISAADLSPLRFQHAESID